MSLQNICFSSILGIRCNNFQTYIELIIDIKSDILITVVTSTFIDLKLM